MTTNTTTESSQAGGEREAFEAAFPRFWSYESFTDDEGQRTYCEDLTQGAWIAWNKLRPIASLSAPPAVLVTYDTWPAYIAGIIEIYIKQNRTDEDRAIGIAKIIKRRLYTLAPPVAAVAQPSQGVKIYLTRHPETGEVIRADGPSEKAAAVAQPVADGPGSPAMRFKLLMKELDKRFPDPEPFRADLPERRLLARIDAALAASPIAPQAGQAGEEKGRG